MGVVQLGNGLAEFVDDMSGSSCFHAQERMEQVFAVPVVSRELADSGQELGCGPNTVRVAYPPWLWLGHEHKWTGIECSPDKSR
jgi:hypothetical protein